MALRFCIRAPAGSGSRTVIVRVVELASSLREIRVGRRAGLEVELPFAPVSSVHARLLRFAGGWQIEDLGSVNGTFLAGARLHPRVPHPLPAHSALRLADVHVEFDEAGDDQGRAADSQGGSGGAEAARGQAEAARAETTGTLARRLVSDLFRAAAGAGNVARVSVIAGPGKGNVLALILPDRSYRLGRAPTCDLVLPNEDVSREHAALERRWDGVFVRDLRSKNGVELDGRRIDGEVRLSDGAEPVLGGSRLRLDDPEDRYLQRMRIEEAPDPGIEEVVVPLASQGSGEGVSEDAEVDRGGAEAGPEAGPSVPPGELASTRPTRLSGGLLAGLAAGFALLLVLGVAAWLIFGD